MGLWARLGGILNDELRFEGNSKQSSLHESVEVGGAPLHSRHTLLPSSDSFPYSTSHLQSVFMAEGPLSTYSLKYLLSCAAGFVACFLDPGYLYLSTCRIKLPPNQLMIMGYTFSPGLSVWSTQLP